MLEVVRVVELLDGAHVVARLNQLEHLLLDFRQVVGLLQGLADGADLLLGKTGFRVGDVVHEGPGGDQLLLRRLLARVQVVPVHVEVLGRAVFLAVADGHDALVVVPELLVAGGRVAAGHVGEVVGGVAELLRELVVAHGGGGRLDERGAVALNGHVLVHQPAQGDDEQHVDDVEQSV